MKTFKFLNYFFMGGLLISLAAFTFKSGSASSEDLVLDAATKAKLFQEFLAAFPQEALPYQLGQEQIVGVLDRMIQGDETAFKDEISTRFDVFVPSIKKGRFSRMGPSSYYFENLIIQEEDRVAVIYSVVRPFGDLPYYVLATYDKKGNLKSENIIASKGYDQLMTARVDRSKNILISEFEFQPSIVPFESAVPEKALKLVSKKVITVQRQGDIEEKPIAALEGHTTGKGRS